MSLVLSLQRIPMKIENCHIRHQRLQQGHRDRHTSNTFISRELGSTRVALRGQHFRWFLVFGSDVHVVGIESCHTSRTAEYPQCVSCLCTSGRASLSYGRFITVPHVSGRSASHTWIWVWIWSHRRLPWWPIRMLSVIRYLSSSFTGNIGYCEHALIAFWHEVPCQ